MIPLGDDLPRLNRPRMTYLILAVTWAVWLLVEKGGLDPYALAKSVCNLGLVPGELTHRVALGTAVPIGPGMVCAVDNSPINIFTPLTSIFVHASWGHILGNSLFFWVFGRSVEDSMGSGRFLAFYFICGLAAAALHIAVNSGSAVPTVGASGAISGVMGAYLLLYPRAHVNMFFIIFVIPIQAWLVLLYWFGLQVLEGLPELGQMNPGVSGGVAVWAHVGGFLTGLLLVSLFADPQLVRRHRSVFGAYYG
ncbi:MAG TPA: rhomboid family intramembrane serine protease [Gemmatimonadaceae bacterium]|nr:rhomboid family intramembrane serine protease [Gemmatimonadaceae bacterium]